MIKSVTLLFIGGTEIVFILLIVVLVFGADKLPEIARIVIDLVTAIIFYFIPDGFLNFYCT